MIMLPINAKAYLWKKPLTFMTQIGQNDPDACSDVWQVMLGAIQGKRWQFCHHVCQIRNDRNIIDQISASHELMFFKLLDVLFENAELLYVKIMLISWMKCSYQV